MTFGRPSICGPAEAETPAMMPSAMSAPASACAIGASSLARLAATNTVTPEVGASATPAGGLPTERPAGATRTHCAAASAGSSASQSPRASSLPGATWPANSWPANWRSCAARRRCASGASVRGVVKRASSTSASLARSRASASSSESPKRAKPKPASNSATKVSASPFCRWRLSSGNMMTATMPITPAADSAKPQLRQNSGLATPRRKSVMDA